MLTAQDLDRIGSKLTPAGLDKVMRENIGLLAGPAGIGLQRQVQRDPLSLLPAFLQGLQKIQGEFRLTIRDGYMVSEDGRHGLLWAESRVPLTDSAQAEEIRKTLSKILSNSPHPGIKIRIIGVLPHTIANNRIIRHDLKALLPVALIFLLCFLILTLRDWRVLIIMVIPFLGAPIAVSLVAAIHGKISAMALGFGIALLGIGVDFAIHIYLHRLAGEKPNRLLKPLILAAMTTIGIFVILLFSQVIAHRQMALLAIIGLTGALLLSWWLVPDLAIPGATAQTRTGFLFRLPENSGRNRRLKIAIWLIVLAGGIWAWPQLHYNGDLQKLDCNDPQIGLDEEIFRNVWGHKEEQAFVVAIEKRLDKALDVNDRVYHFLREQGALGVQSLALIMPGPYVRQQNLARWQKFWLDRPDVMLQLASSGQRAGFTAEAFAPFEDWLAKPTSILTGEELTTGPLRPILASMVKKVVTDGDPYYLVATLVEDTDVNRPVLAALSSVDKAIRVVSPAMWRQVVEEQLRQDVIFLGGLALLWVGGLILVFFRSIRKALAVLAPVLAALAGIALVSLARGSDLNPTQVIMAVMVIGLSVDYGVFMAYSRIQEHENNYAIQAVCICAVSTLSGFGLLSLAAHPVLQSLGITVLAGILFSWPTALFVTPALMVSGHRRRICTRSGQPV